jgi:hypothetical protein
MFQIVYRPGVVITTIDPNGYMMTTYSDRTEKAYFLRESTTITKYLEGISLAELRNPTMRIVLYDKIGINAYFLSKSYFCCLQEFPDR